MTTQSTQDKFQPNFQHRINGDISRSLDLIDIISMMTFRSKGVLQMITANLESDNQASDEIVIAAIHSAIAELDDITATIQAHHAAIRPCRNQDKEVRS